MLIYLISGFFNCLFYFFILCLIHYLDGNPEEIKKTALLFAIYTPIVLFILAFLERRKEEEGIFLSREKISINLNKDKKLDVRWDNLLVGKIRFHFFPTFGKEVELSSAKGEVQRYVFKFHSWRKKSLVKLVKENVPQHHEFYKRIREVYPKDFV